MSLFDALITRLYAGETEDLELLHRVLQVGALPIDWRNYFQQKIEKLNR
ncbi:MAG: 3-alpha domain-containing protein [Nostoc sp.]